MITQRNIHQDKEKNLESKLILQVHDELIVEAKESETEIVKEILKILTSQ